MFANLSGAKIENLTLRDFNLPAASTNTDSGVLAQTIISPTNSVELSKVKVFNSIITPGPNANNIGGLVGRVANGLQARRIRIDNLSIDGDNTNSDHVRFGALIGSHGSSQGRLELSEVKILNSDIEGASSIGGLIGRINNNDNLDHSIREITLTQNQVIGRFGVGGVIGQFQGASGQTQLEKVDFDSTVAPAGIIGSGGDVGGLVGRTESTNNRLIIKQSRVSSNIFVSGIGSIDQVGGLVGLYANGNIMDSLYQGTISITPTLVSHHIGGLAGRMGVSSNFGVKAENN